MDTLNCFGTRLATGDQPPPKADNNNWRLKHDWQTPAEVMQLIRQEKERLRRELAADPRLLTCPKYRRDWDERLAIEQCALWHLFGVR